MQSLVPQQFPQEEIGKEQMSQVHLCSIGRVGLEKAVKTMYERLAVFLVDNLDFGKVSTILEVGCGSGQLTVPFARRLRLIKPSFRVIALDLFRGPYSGDILKSLLREEGLEGFVTPVNADARNMDAIADDSVDLLVSNETLCEFDRIGLDITLQEFHRVLKTGGQMVHGELIQAFENDAQRLMIEANLHSLETSLPKPEWVSPFSDEIAALLSKIGFRDIVVRYFETTVKFRRLNVALRKLKQWHIDPMFIRDHFQDIKRYGLEYPMEHLIFCRK